MYCDFENFTPIINNNDLILDDLNNSNQDSILNLLNKELKNINDKKEIDSDQKQKKCNIKYINNEYEDINKNLDKLKCDLKFTYEQDFNKSSKKELKNKLLINKLTGNSKDQIKMIYDKDDVIDRPNSNIAKQIKSIDDQILKNKIIIDELQNVN